MRSFVTLLLSFALVGNTADAQGADSSSGNKTFFVRNDLLWAGLAAGGTAIVAHYDVDIARSSQSPRFQNRDSSLHRLALNISKVNETTLTLAGIATYGVARLAGSKMVTDVALHATESVVLASVASQLIRGPLGRTRPYVTHDSDQYDFHPGKGFFGKSSFDFRAFPSIHTSSSMAIATVLTMETHRRHPGATKFVAPILFAAGLLPGLARIQLDQHWASDVAAGAFMGVFSAYKVVSYSHAHPDNRLDRMFLSASIMPDTHGRMILAFNPTF
ncbi:MAG: phosphatase PAP2 family protein [bacterium]